MLVKVIPVTAAIDIVVIGMYNLFRNRVTQQPGNRLLQWQQLYAQDQQ